MPESTEAATKPILKWAGGKQALADHLVSFFPKDFEVYYEPFIGGGSVFVALSPQRAVLADQNDWLIETYRAIRDDWKAVARILDTLPNTKTDYLRIRRTNPSSLAPAERAAHLVYLNKTCFRGLFRVNKTGQFNVPYGDYDRRYYDPKNFERFSVALAEADLRSGDFEFGIDGVGTRDFIYFDPPYYKLGGYSDFNRYTAAKFYAADHVRLGATCRELDRRSVRWALSNSDTPLVRSLFRGFRLTRVQARREINLAARARDIAELLVTNY